MIPPAFWFHLIVNLFMCSNWEIEWFHQHSDCILILFDWDFYSCVAIKKLNDSEQISDSILVPLDCDLIHVRHLRNWMIVTATWFLFTFDFFFISFLRLCTIGSLSILCQGFFSFESESGWKNNGENGFWWKKMNINLYLVNYFSSTLIFYLNIKIPDIHFYY